MLSVVVPCFNEEAGLERLRAGVVAALETFTPDFEVLLVDDGSSDRTLEVMRRIAADDPRFRYLSLSRNFGKESAMLAGLSHAAGDVVGIMDADLQHPPELFARMVPLLDQGYDQVVARRTRTGDARARTLVSRAYYRLMNQMVDVKLTDGVGDFRVCCPAARSTRCCRSTSATASPRACSPGSATTPPSSTTRTSCARTARASGACAACSTTASTGCCRSTTGRCGPRCTSACWSRSSRSATRSGCSPTRSSATTRCPATSR